VEDRELVRRVLEGDSSAQELLVKLHRDMLRRTCVHILGYNDPEVEDMVQETFVAAFQKLEAFEFRSSLAHWLRQICVHFCYRRWRQRKRMVVQAQEELEMLFLPSALAREGEKGRELDRFRRMEVLKQGLEGLGKPCRELLGLRDEKGKSYSEISEVLRVPMGTVMSRLARCRKILKELVQRILGKGEI
jgi:RNA polymerase sigma-70 factor (ECF subfamily)